MKHTLLTIVLTVGLTGVAQATEICIVIESGNFIIDYDTGSVYFRLDDANGKPHFWKLPPDHSQIRDDSGRPAASKLLES